MPLRGAMPTWALIPFATGPTYISYWYLTGSEQRWTSPTFGAAKQVGAHIVDALDVPLQPMQVWGVILGTCTAWVWAGIFVHRNTAHDHRGRLATWRTLTLGLGLVSVCAFTVWWGTVGTVQAVRDTRAAPTGAGWLSVVAFAYVLAAIRVASGREIE